MTDIGQSSVSTTPLDIDIWTLIFQTYIDDAIQHVLQYKYAESEDSSFYYTSKAAWCTSSDQFKMTAPLTLGAVCKEWRHTVWSTPSFWSTIFIPLFSAETIKHYHIIDEWLSRAGQHLLVIDVHAFEASHVEFRSTFYPIISLLVRYVDRWKTLHLTLTPSMIMSMISNRQAPNLQELHLYSGDFLNMYHAFTSTVRPNPRRVTVSGLRLRCLDINWDNSTHVVLKDISVEEVRLVMNYARGLTDLKVVAFDHVDSLPSRILAPFNDEIDITTHSHLRILDVSEWLDTEHNVPIFFDHLKLPLLQELVLEYNTEIPFPTSSLITFLQRSKPHLTSLFISCSMCSDSHIIALLKCIPTIEHLEISVVSVTGSSENIFLASRRHLPRLQSFVYCGVSQDLN